MSGEGRASRTSIQRTASVSRNLLQSTTLFAEPPVPLPNLDEIRAADALIRAYYNDLAKAAAGPATTHLISLAVSPDAAAVNAETADASPQAKAVATAESRAAGEVLCAALARDVVEAAAKLYTSRRLDDLVESYTACATWDDACDVVASSFLTQDTCGRGLQRVTASGDSASAATAVNMPPAPSSRVPLSTPIFMRSALALAGIATRQPTCTLTPQSSLSPPSLGTGLLRHPPRTHNTAGPLPPANVPMDAFSRYVTVVEAASAAPNAPDAAATSAQLRTAPTRPRVAKAAAKTADTATAAATSPSLSPVPPTTANPAAKKNARGSQRRSQLQPLSPSSSPLETSPSRGKTLFTAATPPPPDDPLTRALRHGQPTAASDSGVARTERGPLRPSGGQSSSSLGDGGRKTNGRASPHGAGIAGSGSGAVVTVEQDRLWTTERGTKSTVRGGQRKDTVRCRVVTGESGDVNNSAASPAPIEAAATDVKNPSKTDAEQPAAANRKDRPLPSNGRGNGGAGKGKKGVSTEREAWTASFFSATDVAGEASLQDQVQVTPSPGVTVVGGAPANNATNAARRGNKTAANTGTVVHGGEFAVPADRLALSAFDEKRTGTRKTNGGGRLQSPGKVRAAQAFKTV